MSERNLNEWITDGKNYVVLRKIEDMNSYFSRNLEYRIDVKLMCPDVSLGSFTFSAGKSRDEDSAKRIAKKACKVLDHNNIDYEFLDTTEE